MSVIHATDSVYTADELEAVYVLLTEAQQSVRIGDPDDCDDCIEAALERLGLVAPQVLS